MHRVMTYVDGFNLYFGLRTAGLRRCYWLDLVVLSERLLLPGQELVQVHYFSSRIQPLADGSNQPDVRRQSDYLQALLTLPRLKVQFGHFLSKQKRCKACGAEWTTFEEKMSDVNLANQLVLDAVDDHFDTALLISGDSDLAGPVRRVRERYPEKRVVVAFPPRRHSEELKTVAHGFTSIGVDKLRNSLLPDEVPRPSGPALRRPDSWR